MNYGKALRVLRAARGLQQKQLAEKLGVDGSYVSLLESGRRKPSMDIVEASAQLLGVPVYLLMLLASEEQDLKGVTGSEAAAIGKQLLEIVLRSESTE